MPISVRKNRGTSCKNPSISLRFLPQRFTPLPKQCHLRQSTRSTRFLLQLYRSVLWTFLRELYVLLRLNTRRLDLHFSWIGLSAVSDEFFQCYITGQRLSHCQYQPNHYQHHSWCCHRDQHHHQVRIDRRRHEGHHLTGLHRSPSGEVTLVVTGLNYSIPQLEAALADRSNNNWTAGPFLVAFNRTDIIPVQSEFRPLSLHLLSIPPCLFSQCQLCLSVCLQRCQLHHMYHHRLRVSLVQFNARIHWTDRRLSKQYVIVSLIVIIRLCLPVVDWCASGPCLNNGTCRNNLITGGFECICPEAWARVRCAYGGRAVSE